MGHGIVVASEAVSEEQFVAEMLLARLLPEKSITGPLEVKLRSKCFNNLVAVGLEPILEKLTFGAALRIFEVLKNDLLVLEDQSGISGKHHVR